MPERQDGVLDWAVRHLDERLTIASMARHAGLSPRTLIRRFHETTGMTPMRWLHVQRLSLVRELLESTDLSIEQIARRAGMGNGANLRHHFVRTAGVTPTDYRRTFRQ
jgi:transcriptional regulator GlxA family with amidase domain